jgi:uncharacterized protein (DUF1501 family)
MITMLGSLRRCCDGVTRRETLKAGALGLSGLTLPNLLRAQEARGATAPPGRAKSVIVLYLLGGAATQDMVDLKPNAPAEIRGEFRPIDSNVPGIQVCEHLPLLAGWMHRAAVVRSMNHRGGCHNPLPSYTGDERPVPDLVNTSDTYPPSMGSICEYLNRGATGLPAYVYMPCYLGWGQSIRRPGPYGGFLGKRCDPLFTECSPYIDKDAPAERPWYPQVLRGVPQVAGTALSDGLTIDRLASRRGLLGQLDDGIRAAEVAGALATYDRQTRRAFELVTSPRVKAAFNLETEDPKLRDRYGRTLFGSSALIARRLVQAGVRFVNVTWDVYWERLHLQHDGWDTHGRNFAILREYNLPYFDLAASALLGDLESRGLLDETLVVVMSEMGRTPKVNANAGRDHWTYCYSVVLAGAGIRGGTVHGASDAQAAFVKDKPVSPADLCATIYHCLGIDPDTLIQDQTNRPVAIARGGQPIREILA